MGTDGAIDYRVDGAVATITIDRPATLNALTFAMRDALVAAVERAGADPAVRVVVLQGADGTFTSGVDVEDRPDLQDPSARTLAEDTAEIADAASRWRCLWDLGVPVIVKARGHCAGWGLEIALHADMVVSTPDCRFFYPSVRNGSGLPDSAITVHHLGPQWAKRLLMTGDAIDGYTAARIGLVMEVVDDAELDAVVDALARRLASRPTALLAQAKAVVNRAVELQGRAELQEMASVANAIARRDPEAAAFARRLREHGRQAALRWAEERDPPWQ